MLQLKEKVFLKDTAPDELIRVRLIYGIRTPLELNEKIVHMIGALYLQDTEVRARVYDEDEGCFHTEDDNKKQIPMKQLEKIAQDAMIQLDAILKQGKIQLVKKGGGKK